MKNITSWLKEFSLFMLNILFLVSNEETITNATLRLFTTKRINND